MYLVRFLTEQSFDKIVCSVKSFVQKKRSFSEMIFKLFRTIFFRSFLKNDNFINSLNDPFCSIIGFFFSERLPFSLKIPSFKKNNAHIYYKLGFSAKKRL